MARSRVSMSPLSLHQVATIGGALLVVYFVSANYKSLRDTFKK